MATKQIPIVDYLVLGDPTHLEAHECANCGARYFDRRNACAKCGATEFGKAAVASDGVLKGFTIVHRAAPGIEVPYVSAIVETSDGTTVRSNVVDVEPDPEHVTLGMALRLTTYVVGTDDEGTEAVAFGYAPA